MGYCTTREAGRTLDLLDAYCRKQDGSSNVWTYKGKKYFYDITRADQPDGGICGSVALCLPDNMCREVGRFKIDGEGNVVRFPGWPTKDLPKPTGRKPFNNRIGW